MALELDERQRAMLLEMGVRVWLPGTAFAEVPVEPEVGSAQVAPVPPARLPASHTAPQVQRPAAEPAPRVVPAAPQPTPHAPQATALAPSAAALPLPLPDDSVDWPALVQTVEQCRACAACSQRKHPTLQAPALAQADWMVVGDPPDEEEDIAGTPFIGTSGELLSNMLKALGLVRINPLHETQAAQPTRQIAAYVTSVMKCRNAHGAVPLPQDLARCSAFLQREIALVQPRMILSMGRFANQVLLGAQPALANAPLGKVRGSVHQFAGVPVVVTYHPKALLRNTADKAKAWADLCLAADTVEAGGA